MRTKKVDKKCKRCPAMMIQVDVNRKYCNHCSNEMNAVRNKKRDNHKEWEKRKARSKFKCPCCGERKSAKKWKFCHSCQTNIELHDIPDTVSLEHRVIA